MIRVELEIARGRISSSQHFADPILFYSRLLQKTCQSFNDSMFEDFIDKVQ